MSDIHGRMINTAIWRDDWFLSLRESEQHLFMYLLTGPATNLCGIYPLGLMEAGFHTKIEGQEVKRIFEKRFAPDGKAFFEIGYVVLKNHLKHQRFNPNQWKAVESEVNRLPEWLRKRIFDSNDPMFLDFATLSNGSLTLEKGSLMVRTTRVQEGKVIEGNGRKGKGNTNARSAQAPAAKGGNGGIPPNGMGEKVWDAKAMAEAEARGELNL